MSEMHSLYAPAASVLVVDDNDTNLKVAGRLLKLCGIVPDLVSSGEKALELFSLKHYDIIFLDDIMPGLSGVETVRKMHESRMPVPPVIALTANTVPGAREMYLKEGFDSYLSKPVSEEKLKQVLAEFLPAGLITMRNGEKTELFESEKLSEQETMDEGIMEFVPENPMENKMEFEALENAPDNAFLKQILQKLRAAGLQTDEGLKNCAGDPYFYLEMLTDYAFAFDTRSHELETYYSRKDWDSYHILIHALKSTSRTIGADDVSRLAYRLEVASAKADAPAIEAEHDHFLELYQKFADQIIGICESAG